MDGVEVMAWTPQTISTVEKKMKPMPDYLLNQIDIFGETVVLNTFSRRALPYGWWVGSYQPNTKKGGGP